MPYRICENLKLRSIIILSLKAHWQISKNSVSKIIVNVIKHANLQLYRVHPDDVIKKTSQLATSSTSLNKLVRLFIHQRKGLKKVISLNTITKWLLITFKECRSIEKRLLLKTLQYSQINPSVGDLFHSEYCKIFKSTYFEEHLRTAASENVFIKLRKTKNYS